MRYPKLLTTKMLWVLCLPLLVQAQVTEPLAMGPRVKKPKILSIEECKKYAEKEYKLLLSFERNDTADYNLQKDAQITDWAVYLGVDDLPFAVEFLFGKDGLNVMTVVVCMRSERSPWPRNVLDGGWVLTSEVLKRHPGIEKEGLVCDKMSQWVDTLRARGYSIDNRTPYRLYYFENLSSHFFVLFELKRSGKKDEVVIDLYRGFIQDINPEWKTLDDLKNAQINSQFRGHNT